MRVYLTIAGNVHDFCSRNDSCPQVGPKGKTGTRSAPQDSHGNFAAKFDPLKL